MSDERRPKQGPAEELQHALQRYDHGRQHPHEPALVGTFYSSGRCAPYETCIVAAPGAHVFRWSRKPPTWKELQGPPSGKPRSQ